jgi:hypothetical protein
MAKRYARTRDLLANLAREVIDSLPVAFRRQRVLGPRLIFVALLRLCAPGARETLYTVSVHLFMAVGELLRWKAPPDRSNVSRNLRKLTPYLDQVIATTRRIAGMIGRVDPALAVGSGRLLAVDGSWLALPSSPALHAEYGTHHNGNARMRGKATYRPQGLLVVLYDVIAGVPIAHELMPFNGGERNALRMLLPHLKPGDTLLMDRGYMSKSILAQLEEAGVHFVLRVSTGANGWREAREFKERKRRSQIVAFDDGRLTLRLVRATRPRSRSSKGSAAREETVLATNLNLPIDAIRRLYAARWRIESFFGDLKGLQRIQDLHGRDGGALKRAVVGHFLWFTLAAFADHLIEAADRRIGSFSRANRRVVMLLVAFIIDAIVYLRPSSPSVDAAIDHVAKRRPRSRPGRSFKREAKSPDGKWNVARKGGRKLCA